MLPEHPTHGSNPSEDGSQTEFAALQQLNEWLTQNDIDVDRAHDTTERIDRFFREQVGELIDPNAQVGIAASKRGVGPVDVHLYLFLPEGFNRTDLQSSQRLNGLSNAFELAAGFVLLPHISTHLDYMPYDRLQEGGIEPTARLMAENDQAQLLGILINGEQRPS